MRTAYVSRALLFGVVLFSSAVWAVPAPPSAGAAGPQAVADMERLKEEAQTRAVLKIERPEGICYWQIMGGDSLLRMPVKESGFGTLLFSAQIVEEKLRLSVAGESQPLETVLLGRYNLDPAGREAVSKAAATEDSLRFEGREPWRLSTVPKSDFFVLRTKEGMQGCCSCWQYKVYCCPASGMCMGCGTCGDCCGD